jgi:ankyrin repeat protein
MSNFEIFAAVKAGDVDAVTELLGENISLLEQRDEVGATPLHYATLNGHRELVRLLTSHGADVNCRDAEFGATPAGWAIEYIRELGGLLAIEIDDVVYAIERRDAAWVARLLARFPELKHQADSNGVPLETLARICGDEQIANLFEEGNSPAHHEG